MSRKKQQSTLRLQGKKAVADQLAALATPATLIPTVVCFAAIVPGGPSIGAGSGRTCFSKPACQSIASGFSCRMRNRILCPWAEVERRIITGTGNRQAAAPTGGPQEAPSAFWSDSHAPGGKSASPTNRPLQGPAARVAGRACSDGEAIASLRPELPSSCAVTRYWRSNGPRASPIRRLGCWHCYGRFSAKARLVYVANLPGQPLMLPAVQPGCHDGRRFEHRFVRSFPAGGVQSGEKVMI